MSEHSVTESVSISAGRSTVALGGKSFTENLDGVCWGCNHGTRRSHIDNNEAYGGSKAILRPLAFRIKVNVITIIESKVIIEILAPRLKRP